MQYEFVLNLDEKKVERRGDKKLDRIIVCVDEIICKTVEEKEK